MRRFLETGERRLIGETIELVGLRRGGEEFPLSLSLVDWHVDGRTYFTGTIRDISRRVSVDRARRELAAIVDGTADAVIGWGLDGIVTSWNRGAERIYGYDAQEMIGRSLDVLVAPGHESELPELLERVRAGERIENFETVRMRKDWRRIDIALTVSPVHDERGSGQRRLDDRTRHLRAEGRGAQARRERPSLRADQGPGRHLRLRRLLQEAQRGLGGDLRVDARPAAPEPVHRHRPPGRPRGGRERGRQARPRRDHGGVQDPGPDERGWLAVDRVVGVAGRARRPLLLRRSRDQRADGGRADARRRAAPVRRRPADRQRRQLGARPRQRRAHVVGAAVPKPRLRARGPAADVRAGAGAHPSRGPRGGADRDRADLPRHRARVAHLLPGRARRWPGARDRGRGPAADRRRRLAPPAGHQPRRDRRTRRGAAQGRLLRPRLARAPHPPDIDHRLQRAAGRGRSATT